VANGITRDLTFAKKMSEPRANRVSVLTAITAFAAYFALLQRRWPLRTDGEAAKVGGAWLVLTVLFELGFGRLVARRSWRELGAEYDLTRGRLWPAVLAWLAVGPALARRLGH